MKRSIVIMTASWSMMVVGLSLGVSLLGHALIRHFVSQTQGFTVQYPEAWHSCVADEVFCIENFPPSIAVPGVRLPHGGAAIKILTPLQVWPNSKAGMPVTVQAWVELGSAHEKVISRKDVHLSGGQHAVNSVEIRTICCTDEPYQESTSWYFKTQEQMFVGIVTYWQGDGNADKWRAVLRDIVLSMKVIPPAGSSSASVQGKSLLSQSRLNGAQSNMNLLISAASEAGLSATT